MKGPRPASSIRLPLLSRQSQASPRFELRTIHKVLEALIRLLGWLQTTAFGGPPRAAKRGRRIAAELRRLLMPIADWLADEIGRLPEAPDVVAGPVPRWAAEPDRGHTLGG